MNVILLEKIGKLGNVGDTANVKAGYARNYLFPFGKAIAATKTNLAEFEGRRAELMAAHNTNVAASQARADKVAGNSIVIEVNAGDEGRLFGSVGTKDIADAINEVAPAGEVTKSEVQLPHGVIRSTGEYEVTIDFGHDVMTIIALSVVTKQSVSDVSDDGMIEDAFEDESEDEQASAEEEVAAPNSAPEKDGKDSE